MKDEGIVQPVSKEMEQLSRRLHQEVNVPRRNPGSVLPLANLHWHVGTPDRAKLLSPEAAAYIAGLIDGEGTVTLSRLHANENRRVVVCIANTEIQLLEFVRAEFGAGKITRKRVTSVRHTPSFCYSVSGRQALGLLRQIRTHLRSYKRRRADLILARYESLTPRNGKYSSELLEHRRLFEQELLSMSARSRLISR